MIDIAMQLPDVLSASGRTGMEADAASAAGQELAAKIGLTEWLGPLAPIAISPFFGLAVLSGIAAFGPEWLQQQNGMLHRGSAFNSPVLFWIMLGLSVVTSLPRLSKVSKPVALAAEKLETYSAVIILVAIRLFGNPLATGGASESLVGTSVAMAGIGSLSVDVVMAMAAALNVIVINAVKLFFEFLVWLIPIPLVDAMLEAAQKSLCLGWMSLYCYSPLLATALNLSLFLVCAVVFSWVYRRTRYYRHLIAGPILAWLAPNWFAQKGNSFTAFCTHAVARLPAYTPFTIRRLGENEYEAIGRWLWRSVVVRFHEAKVDRETGVLAQTKRLRDSTNDLTFEHRLWVSTDIAVM